jgi:hypothetical protein
MADLPRPRDPAGAGGANRASPPGMPRWVKLSLIVVAVLVLAVVIVMLIAGGNHGPSRHAPGIQAPPISVTAKLTVSGAGLGNRALSEASHG